jgi:hypothetical protein
MTYREKSDLTKLRNAEKCNRLGYGITFSKRGDYYYAGGDIVGNMIQQVVKKAFGISKVAKDIEQVGEGRSYYRFRLERNRELVESCNIMTGKKIMIEAWKKGGCCDPGTETYHCM